MLTLTVVLGAALLLLQVADCWITIHLLSKGAIELNPVSAWAQRHLGNVGWVVAKIVLITTATTLAYLLAGWVALVAAIIISAADFAFDTRSL